MTTIKTAARHLAAVAVAAGMLALAGGAARAAAPAHRSCTTGSITVRASYGPPGKVTADLATADNPPGCAGIWTRAKSQDGLNYYSGIIKITGINTVASTCQDTSDCTHLVKGWLYKHPSGGTVRCRVVYPVTRPWQDCSPHPAAPVHTTAVARRACSGECLGWSAFKVSDTTTRFESWWKQNIHNRQQRARARCVDRVNNRAHDNYGNWKTAIGDRSRSTCNAPYILVHGCIQTRARAGAAITTTCPYPAASVVLTAAYGKQVKAGRVKYG